MLSKKRLTKRLEEMNINTLIDLCRDANKFNGSCVAITMCESIELSQTAKDCIPELADVIAEYPAKLDVDFDLEWCEQLEKHWFKEDGSEVGDLVSMTNKGEKDFYDDYWKPGDGFCYGVWLRDGLPEGVISDATHQNSSFDNYPEDAIAKGLEFYCTDDGAIFFDAKPSMSPDEIFKALQLIAKNSKYLQEHLGFDGDKEEDTSA